MKKLAIPDRKVCVACGVCMKACPKGAMTQMICKLKAKEKL